jgi:hypothetical protein
MNLTEDPHWYGGATNEARLCFLAAKTANISAIWKGVWGQQAGRVLVVASGQAAWPITSDKILGCRSGIQGGHVLSWDPPICSDVNFLS